MCPRCQAELAADGHCPACERRCFDAFVADIRARDRVPGYWETYHRARSDRDYCVEVLVRGAGGRLEWHEVGA